MKINSTVTLGSSDVTINDTSTVNIKSTEILGGLTFKPSNSESNNEAHIRLSDKFVNSNTSGTLLIPSFYDGGYRQTIATQEFVGSKYQPKLTAGTGITIDENNVISSSGGSGSSYTFTDGLTETDGVVKFNYNSLFGTIASNNTTKISADYYGLQIKNDGSALLLES